MDDVFDIGGLGQYLNKLSPEEKAIRLAAFQRILDGKRSSIEELALQTGLTSGQVRKIIIDLAQQGMIVTDERGLVVGSHGLSLTTTGHRLYINGQHLFTWCAADAVGIPAALDADAEIVSNCFQCHGPIEITMFSGEIRYTNQADSRIWVAEADLGRSLVDCA
jgi:alkylmercury lyase